MPGPTPPHRILFVDAFDSFSNNIVSLLETSTENVKVTTISINFHPSGNWLELLNNYHAIVIGPGPGSPLYESDVGCINDILQISEDYGIPVLGICLGFQSICLRYGAELHRLDQPRHGIVHEIHHTDNDIFLGTGKVTATLYNSLCIRIGLEVGKFSKPRGTGRHSERWESSSKKTRRLHPLAWSEPTEDRFGAEDGSILMAVKVIDRPIWGLQFHPESCYSNKACICIIQNWWNKVKDWEGCSARPSKCGFTTRFGEIHSEQYDVASPSGCCSSLGYENILIKLTNDVSPSVHWTAVDIRSSVSTLTTSTLLDICEVPHSHAVVLESRAANGRFTIVSMDSPGSFVLEHNALASTYDIVHQTQHSTYELVGEESIFDILSQLMDIRRRSDGPSAVPFWGGFMGVSGYNMGHEKYGAKARQYKEDVEFNIVDMSLLWVERSIVIDHKTGCVYVQSIRHNDEAWLSAQREELCSYRNMSRLDVYSTLSLSARNSHEHDYYSTRKSVPLGDIHRLTIQNALIHFPNEDDYISRLRACKEHNKFGNSYELCLTTEATISLPRSLLPLAPFNAYILWLILRMHTPSRYTAYLSHPSMNIISASPERFLSWTRPPKQVFEMRPMKGTVRKSPAMTKEKATAILSTRKEVAENLMIADLIRHDMYGVVGSGNVWTEKLMLVEEHARVWQMVTVIKGSKKPSLAVGVTASGMKQEQNLGVKMLQSCLAPGSMTGAPKKRSIELLDGIEQRNRGPYAGVLGYLDIGGGGDWSVIIRSAFRYPRRRTDLDDSVNKTNHENCWRVAAGGAVTTLSTPEGEWDEMKAKMDGVLGIFRPMENMADDEEGEIIRTDQCGGAGEGWGLM